MIRMGHLDIRVDDTFDTSILLAQEGKVAESIIEHSVIRIRADLDSAVHNEAMIHELLHFAWHQTNLPHLLEDHEETVVRALAPWLAQVVRVD
jgi:hypothetical protein